ncbi:radical SAM protein [Streptomyces sp. H51]|uniref:radical SAM protein n=1 Tax=Streptomyces sp. H51 TaxID=3111770 RepID=UPI002D76EF32|nr:radical SAM protein [Streptomyces sp. H51]
MDALPIPDHPLEVIWDITYACPLRCVHCYSESGRRPIRQLSPADMLHVADAIVEMGPHAVCLAGGEALLARGVFAVADRFSEAGVPVSLFTSGWSLKQETAESVLSTFAGVTVSVDGASADVHDRIRGRRGSFARAMDALALLDRLARKRSEAGDSRPDLGIDWVVVRSNFHQIEELITDVAPRFPALDHITFGAVVPEGLASRPGFADHELLSDDQVRLLGSSRYVQKLRALAPPTVRIGTTDNLALQMHPDLIERGVFLPVLQIEPDGLVRGMAAYEGTVGDVLTDPPAELWRRAVERWHDPFVVETLKPVRTMSQWAEATRAIDYHFASETDRRRIDQRPAYEPG